MLLELGKFGSLLLGILCLCALFHAAFLAPTGGFSDRALASLKMLALAAAICLASGWLFRLDEKKAGGGHIAIAATFPMKLFWWTTGIVLALFILSWYFEVYYLPMQGVPPS